VSYILLPKWESEQLRQYMEDILKANAAYLQKFIEALSGQKVSNIDYKLARKNVYLHSANLSAAFQRMLSEPKNKQSNVSHVQEFVVLNHLLFSNIATVVTSVLSKETKAYPAALQHAAKKAHDKLSNSILLLDQQEPISNFRPTHNDQKISEKDEQLMQEQLGFIDKLSTDIYKATKKIIAQ
jgi:uncharacterized membrane protein YccC